MPDKPHILVCSCEDTMPLDVDAIRRGCPGATVEAARFLCRTELDRFRSAVATGGPLTVACTQEAPLFTEVGGEDASTAFVNIRETGGWSVDAAKAGPKMAALLAAAAETPPPVPFVKLESGGVVLVYGRDQAAIEAAELLKDHLDITVLLSQPGELTPRRLTEFPIARGKVRNATGHLGAFEVTVDDFALQSPSSRGELRFGPRKDGAISRCDILLDLSGGAPAFSAADLRDGYLRADPGDPAAVLRMVLKARDLVGSFDKPRYITFTEGLCAHSRSSIVGCRRCLDLCPAGAITSAGNHVAIDPQVCAGCGQCAAACPTGAASYALPPVNSLIRKLRVLLSTYAAAGGVSPLVLFHDEEHGAAMIDALARHGDGLPDRVLPIAVNEVTQIGIETIAAVFAYGGVDLRILARARPRHDILGLRRSIDLAQSILSALGFDGERVALLPCDDPDALGAALRTIVPAKAPPRSSSFLPLGGKRDVMRLALRELHAVAPAPIDVVPLPPGAPLGTVQVRVQGCTLCLSCVSACPTGALRDDPERPTLAFVEDACVQCGLCKATCPEKVIELKPQVDFRPSAASARVIKQEEPFPCIRCGKPFGVRSTIERVISKLEGKHWMYKTGDARLDAIKMCEDCRVVAMTEAEFDPYASPRANPRTTDDYLREREQLKKEHARKDEQ